MTNIKDITQEQIGAKYLEWLELERECSNAREDVFYTDFDGYENESKGVSKPRSGSHIVEAIKGYYELVEKQEDVYTELLELSDLYLANKAIVKGKTKVTECKDCAYDAGHLYTCSKHLPK